MDVSLLPLPQVIPGLSAMVDCSQVPGGLLALRRLHESHFDIQMNYDPAVKLCILHGTYSTVQAALNQLLSQAGDPRIHMGQPPASGSRPDHIVKRSHRQETEDLSRMPNKQIEQREAVQTDRPSEEYNSGSKRDLASGGYEREDTGHRGGASLQLPGPPPTSEDFLLIVDADMFQYLQTFCQKDYQEILSQYGVEVVDVTSEGLTSLFLKVADGVRKGSQDAENLNVARRAMSRFFQENEIEICRDQLPKSILSSRKALERAKENLSARHSKLLLKEDEKNIYIIGNSTDVCEAKQCLLDYSIDHRLSSDLDEKKDDVVRRYKLAPTFRESGPTDFTLREGLSAARRPKSSGPVLGYNVLSGAAEHTGEGASQISAQIPGEGIMSKGGDTPTAPMQNRTSSVTSSLIDARPKTSLHSTVQSAGTLFPSTGSGSTLKRASSFSGTPQQKAEVMGRRSHDDTDESVTVRTRGYNVEMTVAFLVWQHLKEAYRTQVDDLTSDIQMKESCSSISGNVTLTLRGANSSKVKRSQVGLQKLVELVNVDFFVHKLDLSELNISDAADETLLACCADLRSSFSTVTIHISKKSIFLIGRKQLCSQVGAFLKEVFSTDMARMAECLASSSPSNSNPNPLTLGQTNEDQSASHSNNHVMLESCTSNTDGTGRGQERRTNNQANTQFHEGEFVNGSASEPALCKDPVIKEKVKLAGTVERDGQKTSVYVSATGDNGNVTGARPTCPDEDIDPRAKERSLTCTRKDGVQQRHAENEEPRSTRWGIDGQMSYSKLNISIPGHIRDSAIKITYYVPNGIQGVRTHSFYTQLMCLIKAFHRI